MTTKEALATKLLSDHKKKSTCFVGFDGFTDEIIEVVDKRLSPDQYQPMTTMAQFGHRVLDYAGKGCNFELVDRGTKVGGNAPILTQALLEGGHRITFAGAIGLPGEIEPLFQEMAARCELVIPLGPSGHTEALEFHDGKVILGKTAPLAGITHAALLRGVGKQRLTQLLDEADLFVSANWTMLPRMTELWLWLQENILPNISERPRWLFVDLADPAKRTNEDLEECLRTLKAFGGAYRVILGLNETEGLRVASVLGVSSSGGNQSQIAALAAAIREKSGLYSVVIHATRFAVGVAPDQAATVQGFYTPNPVLTTGGGDNFNAGFCNALLYGFSLEEALTCGVATSGYYVRHGQSPSIRQLADVVKNNPI